MFMSVIVFISSFVRIVVSLCSSLYTNLITRGVIEVNLFRLIHMFHLFGLL